MYGFVPYTETILATGVLNSEGVSLLDSAAGAITATLGNGHYIGQIKTVTMIEAGNASTMSITNHATSDPEIVTFDALDEVWVGMWTDTEWVTIALVGATV